ncbi:MAG TPA: helix-turn-helix transcriptional regulator [Guyparkeria sp.]|nr:helix-turn-helix transcriptional regulator [Guyparkeria sp.]
MAWFGSQGKEMKPEDVKKMRNAAGLSTEKAAKQVHVATRTWARYESGDRAIPNGVVHLFCLLNNLPPDKYLGK